jgi:hypothetical protein
LDVIQASQTKKSLNVDVTDFTMTFLDSVVVKALESGLATPYIVKPKIPKGTSELSKLRITSYRVMEDKDRWKEEVDDDISPDKRYIFLSQRFILRDISFVAKASGHWVEGHRQI